MARGIGKVLALSLLALFVAGTAVGAQETEFSFNGVRLNGALLGFLPVPTGADVEFRFPLGTQGLMFALRAAGGYEDRMILRDDITGDPVAEPASFDRIRWFNWPNAQIDAGPLYRMADVGGMRIELFSSLRGRFESNLTTLGAGVFSDARGLFAGSIIAGASADAVVTDAARMKSGFAGEASVEWGPGFLGISGGTDFFRMSAYAEGYLPIARTGRGDLDGISVYAAGYATADLATGSSIPLYVLTTFGGRSLRDGIGGSVRGFQSWGYEARLKAAASAELRCVGPAIFGQAGVRPVATVFADAGYYSGLDGATGLDGAGYPWATDGGLVASTGAGLALGLFDFAYVGLRAGFRLPVSDPLYAVYFPAGKAFFWSITFLMHF